MKAGARFERVALRAAIAAGVAIGTLLVVSRSFLYGQAPAVPYGIFPDLRPVLVLGLVGGLAFAGAFFPGARAATLWTVALLVVAFELDHATIHWFSSFPGTLAGGRLDPVRTLGGAMAIGGILLLAGDVAAGDAKRALEGRGVPAEEALAAQSALVDIGRRRVGTIVAGVAVAAALVYAADGMFGESDLGSGGIGLAVGVAVVAAAAAVLLARPRSA